MLVKCNIWMGCNAATKKRLAKEILIIFFMKAAKSYVREKLYFKNQITLQQDITNI